MLTIIQREVLKGTNLPVTIKEIQVGYLNHPYFKDIYQYLAQNKLPSSNSAISKVLAERYILLDSLLFKLITIPEKETVLLVIPETCADRIITLYHSSGTSRCNRNIPDNNWQILYTSPHALFLFLYKGFSHMPIIQKRQNPYNAITNKDKFDL